jgi:hypothetical protein
MNTNIKNKAKSKQLKVVITFSLVAIVFLGINCSTPAYVQKDDSVSLSDYKTYAWVDTRASENDNTKSATAYADISTHNAVNAELQNWGWVEVTDNPDAFVTYDILVEGSTDVKREAVYTQPYTRYYYNYYRKRWIPVYYPSQFVGYQQYETPVKEGTVTITIIDAKSDKNIWQGWTTENLGQSRITDSDIKRSVRNIFNETK